MRNERCDKHDEPLKSIVFNRPRGFKLINIVLKLSIIFCSTEDFHHSNALRTNYHLTSK